MQAQGQNLPTLDGCATGIQQHWTRPFFRLSEPPLQSHHRMSLWQGCNSIQYPRYGYQFNSLFFKIRKFFPYGRSSLKFCMTNYSRLTLLFCNSDCRVYLPFDIFYIRLIIKKEIPVLVPNPDVFCNTV